MLWKNVFRLNQYDAFVREGEESMYIAKCIVSRIFLAIEIMVFVSVYFFGSDGIAKISQIQQENAQLEADISALSAEIESIDIKIARWSSIRIIKKRLRASSCKWLDQMIK